MKLTVNATKTALVDDVTIRTSQETDSYEIIASFSESEKAAVFTAAKVVERLHQMDGDRTG